MIHSSREEEEALNMLCYSLWKDFLQRAQENVAPEEEEEEEEEEEHNPQEVFSSGRLYCYFRRTQSSSPTLKRPSPPRSPS